MGITLIIVSKFYQDISSDRKKGFESHYQNDEVISGNEYREGKDDFAKDIERDLAEILNRINDVGKVSVMITYKSGKEIITDKDNTINDKTTDERDTEGGVRIINELSTSDKTVMVNGQGGNSTPVIIKEINPEIKGVIVVAGGAKDPKIKQKLSEAVQTVLDIPAYRVIVLETK